jgi:flagellar biosynthesis/type III secretory pathway protein FliH
MSSYEDTQPLPIPKTIYSNPYDLSEIPLAPPPPKNSEKHHKLRGGLLFGLTLCMIGFSWFIGYSVGGEGKSSGSLAYPSPVTNKATGTAQARQLTDFNATATSISDSSDTKVKAAYNSGYQAGYSRGKQDGYTSGYSDGLSASAGKTNNSYQQGYSDGLAAAQSNITAAYNQGKQDGYNVGYSAGYSVGKQDGYNAGYTDGYNKGYTDGESAEYTYLINWIQTHCTKNSSGYYPYIYISNGQLYCQ